MCDRIEVDGKEYSVAKVHKKLWAVLVDGQPSRYQLKPHRQNKQNFWAIVDVLTGQKSPQVYGSRGYALVMAMHALS